LHPEAVGPKLNSESLTSVAVTVEVTVSHKRHVLLLRGLLAVERCGE
jgi:hypothetical protein